MKEKETAILNEYILRANQLKNLRTVMHGSITPKKLKRLETEVLPGYIAREYSARTAADKFIKKAERES